METLARNWANFVISNRVLVLVLTLMTMIISVGTIITNPPPYNNSSEIWFLEDDPDLKAFYEMQEKFGDSEYMAVGIEARQGDKDVFESETIKMIGMITEMLEDHEIVTQVRSLSKYQYTHNDNDMMATDDLFEDIDEIDENPKILEELTDTTCKWPIGHPNEEKFYFCGRKPEGEFPYCKLHVLYAFQPKGSKEEVLDKEDEVPEFIEKKVKSA